MKHLLIAVGCLSVLIIGASAGAQQVQQLWAQNCLMCHGERGETINAESLLRPELLDPRHDLRLFNAIRDGLPDQGMPEFDEALNDRQIWGLVVHLRELQEQDLRQQNPPRRPDDQGIVETTHHRYRLERIIQRGLSIPWSIAFLPDGRMLIAERPGTLRIYDGDSLSAPIEQTPQVRHAGQGGLMGIAVHPDHAEEGWVYLSYSHQLEQDAMQTRIVRGRIENGRWTDQQVIFQAPREHYLSTQWHYGSRIVFDGRGHLFFAIGDRGRAPTAQNLGSPNGKIHRLHDDGRVPQDNPFVDREGAMPSVWSYGHRNPQGLVYDAENDHLWITEHGPRGGDELNLIEPGGNYGWPEVSHGINYNGTPFRTPWHDGQFIDPVKRWVPSIAVCGLDQVRGEAFSQWQGDLLAGGLAGQVVERLRIRDGEVVERERLLERMGRVRDVVCGPDGAIYIALNGPDQIVRLTPTP